MGGGVEIWLHALSPSELDRHYWSASSSGFIPKNEPQPRFVSIKLGEPYSRPGA
jgi:hypothetical protein